jgi:hypothetical protein
MRNRLNAVCSRATALTRIFAIGFSVSLLFFLAGCGGSASPSSNILPPPPATPAISSLSPNSGAVGTPVIISGSNFGSTQGSSTVTFNGTGASVSTWGNASIAAIVPTGATPGNVVVTVNGVSSNGITFTVVTLQPGSIEPSNFGMQCGIGSPINGQVNCKGSGSDPIVWPTAGLNPPAEPGLLRLHDAGTYWAQMNPSSGTYDFTNLDNWLDLIAQHQPIAVSQVFTWTPCWDASNASGTVTTSDTTVTWVSGTQFYVGTYWNNQSITINATVYTIASVSSLTSLTLTTSAGTQSSPVAYSMTDPNCGIDPVAPSGSSDIPADLTASGSPTFNQLVTAFVQHCSAAGNCVGNCPSGQTCASTNLIKYYEMWNEWDLPYHWTNCGTTMESCAQLLYQMVAPAAAIIKQNVANAVILMPSSTPSSPTYQCDFLDWLNLEDTNGHISDWIAWHVYLTNPSGSSTNTPEYQWAHFNQNFLNIQMGGSVSGCSAPPTTQWTNVPWANTETNFSGSTAVDYQCPSAVYNGQDCTGQIVRWQILHDSIGTDGPNNAASGVFWYFWLDTVGSNPQYETAYYYMMQYLVGGKFSAPASSPDTVTWTAPFLESDGTEAVWVWTTDESGTALSVPSGYIDYKDLSGNTHTVTTGQQITLSTEPYLLEQ